MSEQFEERFLDYDEMVAQVEKRLIIKGIVCSTDETDALIRTVVEYFVEEGIFVEFNIQEEDE